MWDTCIIDIMYAKGEAKTAIYRVSVHRSNFRRETVLMRRMKRATFKAEARMIQPAFLPVPAPELELEPEPVALPVLGLGAVLAPLEHNPALL
jgi:hypothetical protein